MCCHGTSRHSARPAARSRSPTQQTAADHNAHNGPPEPDQWCNLSKIGAATLSGHLMKCGGEVAARNNRSSSGSASPPNLDPCWPSATPTGCREHFVFQRLVEFQNFETY